MSVGIVFSGRNNAEAGLDGGAFLAHTARSTFRATERQGRDAKHAKKRKLEAGICEQCGCGDQKRQGGDGHGVQKFYAMEKRSARTTTRVISAARNTGGRCSTTPTYATTHARTASDVHTRESLNLRAYPKQKRGECANVQPGDDQHVRDSGLLKANGFRAIQKTKSMARSTAASSGAPGSRNGAANSPK